MDSTAGTEPAPATRPRPSRRARTLLAIAGAAVLAIAVVAVLTAAGGTGKTRQPLPTARSFTLTELARPGQHVSLAAYSGRPVIINFFASWCAPCKRETPMLASFYREHHGRVLVIGVDSNDQATAALQFLKSEGVTYPVGFDDFPAPVTVSYGVVALPQTFELNARHQIIRHIDGDVTVSQLNAWASNPAEAGPG